MANYDITIELSNGQEVKYSITNSTIDPISVPDTLSTADYHAINQVLSSVTVLRSAGVKSVEIHTD